MWGRLAMATTTRTPNVRLRNSREERGWSQERLATELRRFAVIHEGREAGVTGNMICKWEKGDKKPSLRYQRLLRMLFQHSAAELGFVEDEAPRPVPAVAVAGTGMDGDAAGVERRAFLRIVAAAGGVAAGGVGVAENEPWDRLSAALRRQNIVTQSVVDEMAQRTAGLYGLEERVPAHALMDRVRAHLGNLSQLLENSSRGPVRRELAATAGETAALAGWLAFDMRDGPSARAYYRVAVEAAREAEDNALWACVLGYESYQQTMNGRPDQACALLEQAQRRMGGDTGTVMTRAWLAAREAEEQAARGDAPAALRALDRAHNAFERGTPDTDRVWTQFFDRGRLDGLTLTTFTRLRRRAEAADAAARGLREAGPAATKKRSLLLGDAAEIHLQNGEVDEACRLAADALAIVAQTDFSMGLAKVQRLRGRMRPWEGRQSVRDLDEQMRALD
jgi:transcriptional regulator with XRE-family HTH domain